MTQVTNQTQAPDTSARLKQKKATTFNLCDFDDPSLTFVNRKGVVVYLISFMRFFASDRNRKLGKENEQTKQSLRFSSYNQVNHIESTCLDFNFRTKAAPRTPEAKHYEQRITLTRKLGVRILGEGGAMIGAFDWIRHGEEVKFSVMYGDGSGYHFVHFPPDAEFKPNRKAKAN